MKLPHYLPQSPTNNKIISGFFDEEDTQNDKVHVFEFKEISPHPNPELLTLKFRKGSFEKIIEIYYALPVELHGIFGPWTHFSPKKVIKEKQFLIDASEMTLNQYRLFLRALQDFLPYVKEVRFMVTIESAPSPWIDEIAIENGQLYFHRHTYPKAKKQDEDENKLDYYRNLYQNAPHDENFKIFFQKELLIWAEILLNQNLTERAKKYLEEAEGLDRKNASLWHLNARYYKLSSRWQKMMSCYKKALKIDPRHYWVNREMGDDYFFRENYQKALDHRTMILSCFPKSPAAYFDRGLCHKKLGMEREAEDDFKKTVRNTPPQDVGSLVSYAKTLEQVNEVEDAIVFYKATFKKSRIYFNRNNKPELWEKGGYDLVVLNEIIKSGLDALFRIGQIEWQRKNPKKALQYCDQILKIEFDNGKALIFKGTILLHLKRLRKLTEAVEMLKVMESHNPQTYMLEGGLLIHLGEYAKAAESYGQAAKINPNYYPAYHGVGHALAWMKKDQEAIEYFEKSLQIQPNDASCLSDMASSLNNLGREEEALEYLEKVIRLRPNYYHPYFIKACIFAKQANSKMAIKMIQKMLELDPSQKKWLKKEKDFENIKNRTEFKKLMRKLKI